MLRRSLHPDVIARLEAVPTGTRRQAHHRQPGAHARPLVLPVRATCMDLRLLVASTLGFGLTTITPWILVPMFGIAFSLVPSAMWPAPCS